jgi:acetylornithine/N-succinyldiaminopimelate aminotransferase
MEGIDDSALMFVTRRPQVMFVRGQGSWLYDAAGRAYLDFVQGWAVNALGHSPVELREALAEQAARVLNVSPAYYNEPMCRLATHLARLSGLQRVFFANSGAEANEGAIKLARKWGALERAGAHEIVVLEGAFHGRTLATMSASGKPGWERLFEPKVPGFVRVPHGDLRSLDRAIGPRTCAVMLEAIQGEAGVLPVAEAYLRDARALTERRGVLLILDEIQTGIGRTGRMFAFEHCGIRPDVVTLGKGLGGGVPLAALLAREEVSVFEAGEQGGTFNGSALMTAAGCAVVETVSQPGFLARVCANGLYLADRLRALSNALDLGEVRGHGLLLALELRRPIGNEVVGAGLEHGLLVNAPRATSLRFMPALNVSQAEIDAMIERLEAALRAVG